MDPDRLDALAKTLGANPSRRVALRGLLGGALAGAAALLGGRAVEAGAKCFITGRRCRKNRQCCSRECRFGECR